MVVLSVSAVVLYRGNPYVPLGKPAPSPVLVNAIPSTPARPSALHIGSLAPNVLVESEASTLQDITFTRVSMQKPGFVLVQEMRDQELGKIIGQTSLYPAGHHQPVIIHLPEPATNGAMLSAILLIDNGDGVYTAQDLPARREDGTSLQITFEIEDEAHAPDPLIHNYTSEDPMVMPALTTNPTVSTASIPSEPNVKIAFTGDTEASSGFQSVLDLIKREPGVQMVLQQGDMDYAHGPQVWMNMVDTTLGATFPFFASDGNHDNWASDGYSAYFKDKLTKTNIAVPPAGALPENYSIVFKGIKIVFSQEGGNPTFISQEFAADDHIWKICSWHKNMKLMQIGGKGDEQGWGDYEACRQSGAIIATGHEHSYERTKTLTSMTNQTVDPACSSANSVCVGPGKTFAFVSGLGGNGIRDQTLCLPTSSPYGCKGEWASIYASNQNAEFGVLFITFNINGDPNKAHGEFKNVSGAVIDSFDITAAGTAAPTPTGTAPTTPTGSASTPTGLVPSLTPTGTGTTPTPGTCPPLPVVPPTCTLKSQGDADCDGTINITDLATYTRIVSGYPPKVVGGYTENADFTRDCETGLLDRSVLIATLNGGTNVTPTLTPPPSVTGVITNTPPPGATSTLTPSPTGLTTPPPPTPSVTPTTDPRATPTPTRRPGATAGMWISDAEIMALPTTGSAWSNVQAAAKGSWGTANLSDNNSNHDVMTLAGALVSVRTSDATMRSKTITGLQSATKSGLSRALELSRGLQSYIIAADIIGYHDAAFEAWVRKMLAANIQGHSGNGIVGTATNSANNWGGHARASVAAAALYLQDTALLQKMVTAHKAFIGLPAPGSSLSYEPTNWHAGSPQAGVNVKGAAINGKIVSGVLPEDWRRGGEFKWPPATSGYMWEGMQGFVVAAVLLDRSGHVPFNAGNNAVVRAMDALYAKGEVAANSPPFNNPASGDDTWIPWLVNAYGGTSYPKDATSAGKNMGWTDWTHAK